MIDLFLVGFGSFVISSLLLYAVWSHLRVLFLRQSLFEIRDILWDQAHNLGCFDDPAYLKSRRHMNAMIDLCSLYSYHSLFSLAADCKDYATPAKIRSANEQMQSAIEAAYSAAGDEVMSFILLKRASGLRILLGMAFSAYCRSSITTVRQAMGRIRSLLSSSLVEVLSPLMTDRANN